MGGQAAEQIIAGVVLSERLAVTMYGAIHRAQFNGQRNLRGLIIDPKILSEDTFRITITDPNVIASATKLEHPNIVPTFTVESGGPDVVVVTRGVGRYVTVQDLIASAKSRQKSGGKLSIPVAGLIGKSVIEALANAHKAGVIHGAVHPRSVLIDEDGGIRLDNFVVGRALTTAVSHGGDSSLWRGLTGYIAPELVIGEEPLPGADVFAVGAMLYTMLTGEVPPGVLRCTPAVERLVQRSLDTDPTRRYKSATDLLENLLEAMEDDRWELADRAELIREAGLSAADTNIDDATEDLLASLGTSSVQVTPTRPSQDRMAEASAARHKSPKPNTSGRLDALLADLGGEHTGITHVDDEPFRRDPISELINLDPRKREALVSSARVPSLDDPDDETPLPPPVRESDYERLQRSQRPTSSAPHRSPSSAGRAASSDERAALAAIGELDHGARRVSTAGDQASAAAEKLEQAAERAERAAKRLETGRSPKIDLDEEAKAKPAFKYPVAPITEPVEDFDAKPVRLKSRWPGIIAVLVIIVAGYFIYTQYMKQEDLNEQAKQQKAADKLAADQKQHEAIEDLPDPGAIRVASNPPQAGVWLKIGRTPVDSIPLSSAMMHELRVEGVDGFDPVDTQVMPANWSAGSGANGKGKKRATISVVLKPATKDPKTDKLAPVKLPVMPLKPPEATGFTPGRGPIHVESTPPSAEVWMYIGMTNNVELDGIQAGVAYELRVLADGYLPGYISVTADEWRDGGDPSTPINRAKKKPVLEKSIDLVADPNAPPKDKDKKGK